MLCSAAEPIGLARLAGVIGGLTGFAIADLASWFLAPAAAPLTAVGPTIIDLLPAPLVNWGKETLGTADKPVLLIIIARRRAHPVRRRRAAGAAPAIQPGRTSSPRSPLVGIAAVLSRLPGQVQAVLPTVIGLSAGYTVLHLLIMRLVRSVEAAADLDSTRAGRPPPPESPAIGSRHPICPVRWWCSGAASCAPPC